MRMNPDRAFTYPSIRDFLGDLLGRIHNGPTAEERARAKRYWRWITAQAAGDLRKRKDQADPVALAVAYDAARTCIRAWRGARSAATFMPKLREQFPGWRERDRSCVADALARGAPLHLPLRAAVGREYGLTAGRLRDLVVVGRARSRDAANLARGDAGKRRYEEWLASQTHDQQQ